MLWRVGFCPGGQVFQRFRNPEPVRIGLDGVAPGDLQLPALTDVTEDVGTCPRFRDREGPAGIAWEIIPVDRFPLQNRAVSEPCKQFLYGHSYLPKSEI